MVMPWAVVVRIATRGRRWCSAILVGCRRLRGVRVIKASLALAATPLDGVLGLVVTFARVGGLPMLVAALPLALAVALACAGRVSGPGLAHAVLGGEGVGGAWLLGDQSLDLIADVLVILRRVFAV